ncbi:MAG TPA: alanine:cation symporter family protein, partial [Clostridia bacterium]|nr:alanine:cation symporter family protein [Clostridia bacterium]
ALLIGSVSKLGFVWTLADTMNALMAIPNLVALLLLSGVIVEETRKYLWSGNLDKSEDEITETIA